MWLSHPTFRTLVDNSWSNQPNITKAIDNFCSKVIEWNKNTFGNIFKRKNKILARLKGIKNLLDYPHSQFLINLENELLNKYNLVLM